MAFLSGNLKKIKKIQILFYVDYEQTLFFLSPSNKKARDTQITTRMTEGALAFRASRRINAFARMDSPR